MYFPESMNFQYFFFDTYIGYFAAMWAQGSEIQRAMDLA